MSSRRGSYTPTAAPSSGFDFMADALTRHLHTTFDTSAKTVVGVINTAFKNLKSSFILLLKGVATANASHVTPSRSSLIRPSSMRRLSSPVSFPSLENYVTQSQDSPDSDADSNPINQPHRKDQQYIPFSCATQAPRRLTNSEIVRLRHNDQFILLIPPTTRKDPKSYSKVCKDTLDKMRKMVLHDHRNSSTPASRQEYWESELQTRRVERNGMEGHPSRA